MLATAMPAAADPGWSPLVVDTFDRLVVNGLGAASAGEYSSYPATGAAVLSVANGVATVNGLQPGRSMGAVLTQTSSSDTSVKAVLAPPALTGGALYFGLQARQQADRSAYRGRVIVAAGGQLALSFSRTAGSSEAILGTLPIDVTLQPGQKLAVRFEVTGIDPVQLRGRAWADGGAEPGWQYELTDGSSARITQAGSVGFWSYASSAGSPITYAIEDFSAETSATTSTTTPPPPPAPVITPAVAAVTGKPSAANAGVAANLALAPYSGPTTITVDGTVIDGKAVYSDLKVAAKNVIIRNSYLHCGTGNPPGNSGCVDANSGAVYNLLVQNTTIIPDHPSYYRDGIVGHEFTARNNHISRTNDGIGIFNKPGGSLLANVTVQGNYIHDLTHWNNDPAHSDGTHNDAIQIQGGQNISITGNAIVGSVVAGDGLGTYGTHGGSGLIVNQNVSKVGALNVSGNWLDDGQNSVFVTNGNYPSVSFTLGGNFFGRNQYVFNGNSRYAIRIASKSKSQISSLSSNHWEDNNVLMTEGKDTGIRYTTG